MKANDILTLLLLSCMLVGCKECEDAWVVGRIRCDIEGITCEEKYKHMFFSPERYYPDFTYNDKVFNFRFDAETSQEILEQTGVFLMEIRAKFPERPQLGTIYPLMNLCDIDWDNPPETVCWAKLICIPEIGEDTRFPEESRGRMASICTDRSSGYIIFDEINMTSDDGLYGTVSGRFGFVAEGESERHPEINVKVSVANGAFTYSVCNTNSNGSYLFSMTDYYCNCIFE